MKHLAHGAEWTTQDGVITAYVRLGEWSGDSLADWLSAFHFKAQPTSLDAPDAIPPVKVPHDLVTAKVPVSKLDAFVSRMANFNDVADVAMIFPSVNDAWQVVNAEVSYEDTSWGKAIRQVAECAVTTVRLWLRSASPITSSTIDEIRDIFKGCDLDFDQEMSDAEVSCVTVTGLQQALVFKRLHHSSFAVMDYSIGRVEHAAATCVECLARREH